MDYCGAQPLSRRTLLERTVPIDYASVRPARRAMATALAAGGCRDDIAADAELVVSELVTNAVEHARDHVVVRLLLVGDRVRLEVADDGGGRPHRGEPRPDQRSGRGLLIVERVALRWGVDEEADGKTVWAEFLC